MPGTITADRFVASLGLATSQLADGDDFIQRDGSVAFTANQSLGNFKITNLADPVAVTDAVNLRTAQALINGINILPTCRVVATTNQTLTGLPTVDSVTLVANDRIFLSAQTTASQNGPWIVAAGAWTRPADYAAAAVKKAGIMVLIEAGTVYHDTKWLSVTDGNVTVDTTSTVWTQDLSGIVYTAGSGISLTGNAFAAKYGDGVEDNGSGFIRVKLDGTSLSRSASGIKIANGTAGRILMANASGVATYTAMTGDATISSTGTVTVNTTVGSGFVKFSSFVQNETPGGTVNDVNTAFTLANTPNGTNTQLYLNGQLLEPGAGNDYTLSGNAITMLYIPQTGDKLRAYYNK